MPVLALLAILLLALLCLTGEEEGESWRKVVEQEEFTGLPKDSIFFLELRPTAEAKAEAEEEEADPPRRAEGADEDDIALCALESAAFYNSENPVVLVTSTGYRIGPGLAALLRDYTNLKVVSVKPRDIVGESKGFGGNSLKQLLERRSGAFHYYHLSDVLRIFLLFRYGGTYLDTDVISLRPLSSASGGDAPENFVVFEGPRRLCNGLLRFRNPGHWFPKEVAELIGKTNFDSSRSSSWASVGPEVITKAAERLCQKGSLNWSFTGDECRGVRGLPYTSFLYVPLERWSDFIIHKDPSSALDRCLGMEEVSYGAHVWAHAIRNNGLPRTFGWLRKSQTLYHLARRHCPDTFWRSRKAQGKEKKGKV